MHIDEELFQKEEFKRNLKLYEEAVKKGNKVFMDIDDMTDIIDYYNYDGRIDKANAMADYALELYPGAIGPHVFKARQAIAMGDKDEARRQCEAIDDKSDIDYFYLTVELEIANANIPRAERMILQAYKKLEPEERDNFLLDIGALYVDYNYVMPAESWLNKMNDKEHKERLELIARIHCSKGDYEAAIKVLESLIDKNPFMYRYWNTMGIIYLFENKFDECRNCAEYSLAINPDNTDGLWCLGKSLAGQGNPKEAIAAFKKFMKRIPNNAKAEVEMGSCLLMTGDMDKACKYLNKAIDHCEEDPMVMTQASDDLAFIYSSKKDIEKALDYLDLSEEYAQYIDDMPNAENQRLVLRGHVHLMNNQLEEGLKFFDKAVKKSKRDPEIIFKIMVSLYDHELYEHVITYYRKLVRVMPEGWNQGYTYAAVSFLRTMEISKGVKLMQKACIVNPDEVELIFGDFFPPGLKKEQYYDYVKNVKI